MQIAGTINTGDGIELLLAEGSIWVLTHSPPDLWLAARVDPQTGEIIARVHSAGMGATEIAGGSNGIWVASNGSTSGECDGIDDEGYEPGTRDAYVKGVPSKINECDDVNDGIARIDPRTNQIEWGIPFADWSPHGLAVTTEGIWLVADGFITRRDPGSARFKRLAEARDVDSLHEGFGTLWGVTSDHVSRHSLATGKTVATIAIDDVRTIAFGPDSVWATTGTDVVRINPQSNQIVSRIAVDDPWGVAAESERVVVTGFRSHKLHRIDPVTNKVVETIDLGPPTSEIFPVTTGVILAAGSAWVLNGNLVRVTF